MVRSLWTAATGMVGQQTNVDTIANNLANVNTAGYKTQVAEFKSLLYQTLQTKTTSANGEEKPINAQVGLGVRNSAITSIFRQGGMLESSSDTAFAIDGKGFFGVEGPDSEKYYTRNGNFTLVKSSNNGEMTLATSDGHKVLNDQGRPIKFASSLIASEITINSEGEFLYPDAKGQPQYMGIRLGVFQFSNPSGLEKMEGSLYKQSDASGQVLNEARANNVTKSKIVKGYLEGSNVQVADEMVNLIVAQRAYEMNSKAIQASDEMLQQANQLRR